MQNDIFTSIYDLIHSLKNIIEENNKLHKENIRLIGRVAEGTCFENKHRRNPIVSSNLTSTAKEDKIASDPLNDFITIKQLITENPAFTEGGIRALIFHEKRNGFGSCIRRIGRKILISKSKFLIWINKENDSEQ